MANKPDRAKMRPDCVFACIDHVTYMERQMDEQTDETTKKLGRLGIMLVDHLFQSRISPWPKTVEKRGFCTCVTDGPTDRRTDRRTDGRTDRPSYRDVFLWTHLKIRLSRVDREIEKMLW